MKSKLDEANLRTSCKDCLFAKYHGDTQVDCLADRIAAFGDDAVEAYDEDKEFYVIARVCNMFRPEEWNSGVADVNKAKEEVKLSFAVMIVADEMDEEQLEKTVSNVHKIDYDKEKVKIIISELAGSNSKLCLKLFKELRSLGLNPLLMQSKHELAREMDGFIKAKGSFYVSKIPAGQTIPPNLFSNINSAVNDNLTMPVYIQCNDFHMILFSVLNMHYLEYKDYKSLSESVLEQALKVDKYIEINE